MQISLNLTDNIFEGSFPTSSSLSQLDHLELILSNSQLTGNIPKFTKNIIINVSGNLGFKLIKEDGVLSRKCHQRSKLALPLDLFPLWQ
uniref:Uncharacterized protein n=1 Tax=Brassica oleracea TaxID=3712 RepID=A0A3P6GY87_BRAOL|nr:unnamed protein product [Brassica oleracea]